MADTVHSGRPINRPESVLPHVSIIIPFQGHKEELQIMLQKLDAQEYPGGSVDVICVDNGTEPSVSAEELKTEKVKVILLSERNRLNSPYSARNRGVEKATGDILIFVDANSIPEAGWLREGVRCMIQSGADLVAGHVNFIFDHPPEGAEIVDALTSINQKKAVDERGVAYTANLFVRRELFSTSGLFEEGVRSGGDVRWTARAVQGGARIVYCDQATIRKYARKANQLYKKKRRTGRGYYYTWITEAERRPWWYNMLRSLKPPAPSRLRNAWMERYGEPMPGSLLSAWFFFYTAAVTEQLAFVREYFQNRQSR